jgi:hypothetical protein
MRTGIKTFLSGPLALLTLCAGVLPLCARPQQPDTRRPRGIYAVVATEKLIAAETKANPTITAAQLDSYFEGLPSRSSASLTSKATACRSTSTCPPGTRIRSY